MVYQYTLQRQGFQLAASNDKLYTGSLLSLHTCGRQQQVCSFLCLLGVEIAGKTGPYPLETVSGHTKAGLCWPRAQEKLQGGVRLSVVPAVLAHKFSTVREQRARDWIRFVFAVGQSRNGQKTEGIKAVVCPFCFWSASRSGLILGTLAFSHQESNTLY